MSFCCLYSTLLPQAGRSTKLRWAPHSGNLTPPRISPSCPHYVPLWLGRSTIVRGQDHCEAACQSCFWMDGYRSSPCWAVFIQKICTGGLRASSASLFHFWLIRLMSFSRWICTFQAARGGLKCPLITDRDKITTFYNLI